MRQVSSVSSEEQSVSDFQRLSKTEQRLFDFLICKVQCSRQLQLLECGDFLLPLHCQKFAAVVHVFGEFV